jgi:hypothetical protein
MKRKVLIIGILFPLFIFLCIKCSSNKKQLNELNVKRGELLFNSSGCTQCHSLKGEIRYGPPLIFTLNSEIIVFRSENERSIKLNRKYIVRSITYPEQEKLDGYQNKKMPSTNLSPEDIDCITDYLISINKK